MLCELGLDERLLPPLQDAGTPAGGLLAGVAEEVGLLAGTPVHTGGGDTHVSALGTAAVRPGVIAVVAGSTTAIQLTAERVPAGAAQAPLISAHLHPGQYARHAALVDIARQPAMLIALEMELAQDAVFEQPYSHFEGRGVDYNFAFHGSALPNGPRIQSR